MKILVQWAKSTPEDWEEIDSDDWHKLAKKDKGAAVDDQSGTIHCVNIQGVGFTGYDHYHVESINDRGCKITAWNDDPDGEEATIWEFLPLAPDPLVGGRYNTRQSRMVYVDKEDKRSYYLRTEKTSVLYRSEFKEPEDKRIRHGHQTDPDTHKLYHEAAPSGGWDDWIEGVPSDRIHNGKVHG